MIRQMASYLLISYLIIIYSENNLAQTIDDYYSPNISLVLENFSISACRDQMIINVSLFTCPVPRGSLNFTDKSCLTKKILDFDNEICVVTTITPPIQTTLSQGKDEDENYIGPYGNISFTVCDLSISCSNGGSCHLDKTLPYGYSCQCQPGFSGYDCEDDNRICKNNTCWHKGDCKVIDEILLSDNITTFDCQCEYGYDGTNCEFVSDMCWNITCQNKGFCFSSYLSWSCQCLDSTYGDYCEFRSPSLIVKQVLSKSFASIAITAIIVVYLFVFIMDMLKYVFGIDPVDRERRLMKLEQEKKKFKKKKKINKRQIKNALRFFYIT